MGSGNPLKRAGNAIKTAGENVADSEWRSRIAKEGIAGATDPGALLTGLLFPPAYLFAAAQSARETHKLGNQQQDQEAAAQQALDDQQVALEEQQAIADEQEAQALSDADSTRAEELKTDKERSRRLGRGRRGLLYQGNVQGVTTKLGGGS